MSAEPLAPDASSIGHGRDLGTVQTLKRGFALSPQLRQGLVLTLVLALVATGGRVLIPLAVQQTLDRGILAPGGPDTGLVTRLVLLAALAVLGTAVATYFVNVRLVTASESGLATLRTKAFRHVHDLSVLTQSS